MAESDAEVIWSALQEFIPALQRRDPTVRRWIAPQSEAELLLDIYGEDGLLLLLKDYLERERFILLRIDRAPEQKATVRRVEIAWTSPQKTPPAPSDRVSLQVRKVRRKWLVEDVWPTPLDAPLTVDQARQAWALHEDHADPAAIFIAGATMTPPEGCGELDDVETLFVLGMDARGYSPREVVRAVRMWRDFCHLERSAYRRPAAYAAAVEYAFSLLGLYQNDSQERIAAFYDVPATSLRRRFARLRQGLALTYFDPRYSCFGPAPDEFQARCRAAGLPWPPPLRGRLDDLATRQLP
jgi:hypothetical protein